MTTEGITPIMASIRSVVARLTPAQFLTSRLPKFSESLISKPEAGNLSQGVPSSIPWTKYAVDGPYTSMLDYLKSESRVVAIGEHHHQPSILNLQLQLVDALSSEHPNETVLVVEYFNLAQAQMLTDFSNEKLNLSELASAYARSSERFDVDGHLAPLLLLAKEKRVPIIAGFPPREDARDFLKDHEGVLSKLKDEFAFDRPEDTKSKNLQYEAYFESLLSGNAPRETVPEGEARKGARIIPAQLLKDAVMAWQIDRQLAKGKRVVAIAGSGHLEYGFGILERVRQAKREEMVLIACKSRNESTLWQHEVPVAGGRGTAGAEDLASGRAISAADRTIADAVYLYDAV